MIPAPETSDGLRALAQEIAAARRRISRGENVDLSPMPERISAIFRDVGGLLQAGDQQVMIGLISECDALLREIETVHGQLSQSLRQERRRQQVVSAYGQPKDAG